MKPRLLAFTEQGFRLAQSLARNLDGEASRCGGELTLEQWTRDGFCQAEGLIFVGAVGIAVRAIAPWIRGKDKDPAVVVVDETGAFAVPILSGHLGGANDLARRIAGLCGAVPVVTTATDLHGVFAVDSWARKQGCLLLEPERIKGISARLLAGESIYYTSDWSVEGEVPAGLCAAREEPPAFSLSLYCGYEQTLHIVPPIVSLGIGCRRGTTQEQLERVFSCFLARLALRPEAIIQVCSIDLKQGERGLLDFCQAHGYRFLTFSSEELAAAEGIFSSSSFVREVTGVDNVCQRSAVLGSGGTLLGEKYVQAGVTMAAASAPFHPNWRWRDG